ncbi:hypothetical protein HYDPIDRAFT_111550 [Hydnomerulius pinastri MD-312]|uniref:Uncharacterized protein n=1 Tax=Hydnomerulius pinastri MD-312 TaxID=994086 RepID=A0A0C9VH04_9AGAM|nr:hypothetical protein HYDPIDRAFT_120308 [Hydnomerulius pinastri MD-312]KIJ64889.1 hypothetical protein HYDPIDRAFT_111550 [Hydnomerulius pinastri MD-312]
MASTDAGIPPMDKISLVGIWIETVLYGFNCIVYGLCMFVLLRKGRGPGTSWMLSITSTVLFLLCTVHVAASLQQLLEAFIYAPPIPGYSSAYWLSQTASMAVLKAVLYDCLGFLQDIVLIWRLYIVWGRKWQIAALPIIFELGHMSVAYAGTVLVTKPGVALYGSVFARLGLAGWAMDITLNVGVTFAIAARLWWMGRKVSSLTSSNPTPNPYLSTMYTIIESGGLFASVTVVMLGLYLSGSPLAFTGLDISCQLAVLTPLLIVVRVGLGLTHGLPKAYEQATISSGLRFTRSAQSGPGVQVAHAVELDHFSNQSQIFTSAHSDLKDYPVRGDMKV